MTGASALGQVRGREPSIHCAMLAMRPILPWPRPITRYGKMSPAVFDSAAEKRAWTSAQFTTFQKALM
ncbi:Uncharacterised protein [Mycobacteroides abscessus subsp. massiliense]|nr:Uncharacterised protein [Mycobacteroides abscessus subsp. massiliense]